MIVIALLGFWVNALNWVLDAFPVASFDGSWLVAAKSAFSVALLLDDYLPMHEMFDALAIYLVLAASIHGGNLVRRVVSLFTGGGGA